MAKDQTLKIIDMQSFIGGEADNPYMGPANCCARAVGVDLLSKPGIVSLSNELEEVVDFGKDICHITNIKNFGLEDVYYVTYRDGDKCKLSISIQNTGVFEEVYTFNDIQEITSICVNEGAGRLNIYYYGSKFVGYTDGKPLYDLYIYKSFCDGDGRPHTFTILEIIREVQAKNSEAIVYTMNLNSKVYIAFGDTVFTQDDNEVIVDELILPMGETISGMTEYLGTIKIYSFCGDDTYLYTWDGVDYLPTTRQVWKGIVIPYIGGVLNNGAYDYVITKDGTLYLITGTQKQKIKVSNEEIDRDLYRLLNIKDEMLYIADYKGDIYIYGTKYPGMSNSLNVIHTLGSGGATFMCGRYITGLQNLYTVSNKLYNTTHRIRWSEWEGGSVIGTYDNFTGGYIQSMFYTIDQWKNMTFEMMKMRLKLPYGTILIMYRTDKNENWRLFKRIEDYKQENKITVSIREFNENNPWDFTGIQFMFVLQRDNIFGYDEGPGPEIGRCTVFLREVEENI